MQKGNGIYYIVQGNVPVEKSLTVQVVVASELPNSDVSLKALSDVLDDATAKTVARIVLKVNDEPDIKKPTAIVKLYYGSTRWKL